MTLQLTCRSRVLDLSRRTLIMGIVNVTPDSFSDGGKYFDLERAVEHAVELCRQGADIIDVGGESTRPGAEPVPADEEMRRVVPVIERLARRVTVPISVDTYKACVAEEALAAGAAMVNDISALRADPHMAEVVRRFGAAVVLMHMQGEPRTMQLDPRYQDVVGDIIAFLQERALACTAHGIPRSCLIADPGLGFGKTVEHNFEIIRRLAEFRCLQLPLLVGPSRKSFVGAVTGLPPQERLEGTAAAVAACVLNGAHIVRVHDVQAMRRVVAVADAIARKEPAH
ncbi:MAG: dihydropteroate synthase [bacterium]|nr:dihydropteroate synthase [candidate division KSB1 bacterium]MDH7560546.1 dihydropteroate synthase [bacterium]